MSSRIVTVEESIKDRLGAEIEGVAPLERSMRKADGSVVMVPLQVESFPNKLTALKLKTLSAVGAVLVRYMGSRYGPLVGVEQERLMAFEVVVVSDSLRAEDAHVGCYEMLDLALERLIGFKPVDCRGGVELFEDQFLEELEGTWQYGAQVRVKSVMVQPMMTESEDLTLPLLVSVVDDKL